MSHSVEKSRVGRQPFAAIKLSLDYCTLSYGRDECSAGREETGVAQGGAAGSITLALAASAVDDFYLNWVVYLSVGTGFDQEAKITAYDGTTKIALVEVDWAVVPDTTSGYTLIKRPTACYNTRFTCQDTPNYTPSATENEVWLTTATEDFPADLWDTANLGVAIPCLGAINATPPKIDIAGGLGQRAAITADFVDFPHHDRGIDKYVDSRAYVPEEQGTFWGKFIARNPYYQGRSMTYYEGYLVNKTFDVSNFHARLYVIEKISGPDKNDKVKIQAKDVLKLADDRRAFVPIPTTGSLTVDLLSGNTTSMSVTTGSGTEYDASGYVRLNSEIIEYTSVVGDSLFGLTRGQWGTAIDAHEAGDSVQLCKAYEAVNVVEIIKDLLINFAGIDAAFIPSATWDIERDTWLSANVLTTIISEPTGVNKLLKELVQENLLYMWWADYLLEIGLKAFSPVSEVTTIDDDSNLIAGSVKVWQEPDLRVSQVWMYHDIRDFTDDGTDNFRRLYISADLESEGPTKYDQKSVRRIESRWISSVNAGLVIQYSGRTLSLMSETPRLAKFRLDAKDEVEIGSFVSINTRMLQSSDGSNLSLDALVIEKRQVQSGTTYEYTAQEFLFTGKYGYVGPDTLPDYSGDFILKEDGGEILLENGDFILLEDATIMNGATSEQKSTYAWISPDSGFFENGDEAYKIL